VGIVLDPTRFDAEKRELVVPVRIRNTTADTLSSPNCGYPNERCRHHARAQRVHALGGRRHDPERHHAEPGAGASFDFSDALGTLGLLAPGAVSGAVDFRLRVATPAASGSGGAWWSRQGLDGSERDSPRFRLPRQAHTCVRHRRHVAREC